MSKRRAPSVKRLSRCSIEAWVPGFNSSRLTWIFAYLTLIRKQTVLRANHLVCPSLHSNRQLRQSATTLSNMPLELTRRKQYAIEHDGTPVFKRDGRGNLLKHKWELITSHSARRSAITNLHKLGLRERDLIVFSGHTNLKNLEKYIKTGLSEEADRIAEKMNTVAKEVEFKKEA